MYDPNNMEVVKYHLEKYLKKLIKYMRNLDWNGLVKLHLLSGFYQVLRGKKLEGEWNKFAYKVFNFTTTKSQATALLNLSTDELIGMLESV